MGRLISSMSVSLDGFIETPGRSLGSPDRDRSRDTVEAWLPPTRSRALAQQTGWMSSAHEVRHGPVLMGIVAGESRNARGFRTVVRVDEDGAGVPEVATGRGGRGSVWIGPER